MSATDAENTITDQYENQTGIKLTSVSYDTGDAEVGAEFTCTGQNEAGIDLGIAATLIDINKDTDKASFDWNVTEAKAPGAVFADPATQILRQQGTPVASIECPDDIVIESGTDRSANLTLTDGDGSFNVNLGPPANVS